MQSPGEIRHEDVQRTALAQPAAVPPKDFGSAPHVSQRMRAALALLYEAYEYAQELDRSVWDFAVEIDVLRNTGLSNSDFRWLAYNGFVEHAHEVTLINERQRSFRPNTSPIFGRTTSFVLTEAGERAARHTLSRFSFSGNPATVPATSSSGGWDDGPVPQWDRDRQELRVGGVIVKQFKVPARNQELILATFQEEGWPVRIDDPLPQHPGVDSKRRLHDTVNSLNRSHKTRLMRFMGDGRGLGVRWTLVQPTDSKRGSNGSFTR